MPEQAQACTWTADDVKRHIKELEAERDELLKKENLTPEEQEHLRELKRKIYRSKVRNSCC